MKTTLNPYIHFKDNARQAMEFYKTVFGGELTLNTFGESNMPVDPAETDLIMHGMIVTEGGITLMGADTPVHMESKPGDTITISLSGDNEAELRGYFEKLSDGGTVTMPLEKAPWGDSFGMVLDQFGIDWMVNISAAKPDDAAGPAA